ncbi:MAG: beta-lactamase family protein [Oscillospiraceae bacterium]|nr:beta-lactamase family protein [Oscillospiraceae bacterium]
MLYKQGKIQCKPSEIGYDENRLDVLNSHFNSLVEDGTLYCATYCISRKGKVFAHGGIGYKTYEKDPAQPVSPTDVHYIASMTKTFAGVAIMKLVEDGITTLEIPVGEILPQFDSPPFNGITLFHLLTHTSGMHADGGCFENKHNQGGYWHFIEQAYGAYLNKQKSGKASASAKAAAKTASAKFDWISAALAHGVRTETGKEWAYCSFGFTILGAVIEKLTGIHAHKYIEDSICKPLGLNDTGFDLTPEMAKKYILQSKDSKKYAADTISGKPPKRDEMWDTIPRTGGGMKSTVWDVVRYGNMMLHGGSFDGVRILSRKAVEKMTAISITKPDYCWNPAGSVRNYAIGFDHRNGPQFSFSDSTFMHEGAGACALYIDPCEELVAAWIVPYAKEGWFPKAMYNPVNIIWSGLL